MTWKRRVRRPWGTLRAALLASLAACASGVPERLDPEALDAERRALLGPGVCLRDPGGPVELWGTWLERDTSETSRTVLGAARAEAALSDLEAALEELERGLEVDPACPTLRAARGCLLADMGFTRLAEAELEGTTRLRPDWTHLWWALGVVRRDLRLLRSADDALRTAYELGQRDPELLLERAEIKLALGEQDVAAALYALRGRVLEDRGDQEAARSALASALRLETDPDRRKALEHRLALK